MRISIFMSLYTIPKFILAVILFILILEMILGACIVVFFLLVGGLHLSSYLPLRVIKVLNIGCEILVGVFIALFFLLLYAAIELIFKKYEFANLSFYLPAEITIRLPKILQFFNIVFTKNGIVFYFMILAFYPVSLYCLFISRGRWIEWYRYFGGYMAILWVLFIIIFTDNFLIACIGHVLIYYILFFGIYSTLWRYSNVRVPVTIGVFFFGGVILVIVGVFGLYLVTGSFTWSNRQGVSIEGWSQCIIQHCFYVGILLPVVLFPTCYRTLGNCKALPTSFIIFFHTVFFLEGFFMVILIYNLFRRVTFTYPFFFVICITIIILTIYLIFEVKFRKIISLATTSHFFLILMIYVLDPTTLQHGLLLALWMQLLSAAGFITILAWYSRCYDKCITIFMRGVVYKYPGTACANLIFLWPFSCCIGIFLDEVYGQFTCRSDNIIALNIFTIIAINFIIVWSVLIWRLIALVFIMPKVPDMTTPKRFNYLEIGILVYLLILFITGMSIPWIIYW